MSGGDAFSSLAQRLRVHARVVQLLELALHHVLILMIGHAEPARARSQHGDGKLAAVDEQSDQARQQALGLLFVRGQRAEEILEVRVEFSKSHGVKPQKFIETGVSGA